MFWILALVVSESEATACCGGDGMSGVDAAWLWRSKLLPQTSSTG